MSRVRILHLPRDCTEEQLRRHIFSSLPPSAPHIEITDCVIKRSDPNRGGNGVIRMAFMGFRNAASGHFVVRHFNGTYFGSAKLRVEVAKGLGEVGITTNMKKKMEAAQQHEQLSKGGDHNNNNSNVSGAVKRSRDAVQGDTTRNEEDEKETDEKDAQSRRRKERLDEFITERTKATSGPTWASEVLLPESANVNIDPTGDAMLGTKKGEEEEQKEQQQEEELDPEEEERRALERQQALGEVSDMDFLASLANKKDVKHTDGKEGEDDGKSKEEEEEEKEKEQQQQCPLTSSSVVDEQEAIVYESRRVRIGNIPFIATEDDVKQFASSLVGPVESVHIPLTRDTRQSKGAAFVKFQRVDDAIRALKICRGAVFMGRLLRVSAAEDDPYTKKLEEGGHSGSGMGLAGSSEFKRQKEQQLQQQQQNENGGPMAWSSTYMSSHAAVETVAKRLGVTAGSVVSVEARGAAVRAAIAEAYLTTEIQQVLGDEGIDFGLLENAQQNLLKARSNTTILVKNISAATTGDDAAELTKMFLRYGALETTAFPSAGTFALFRYVHQQDARVAFQRLSYKLFKNAPLFLEWAPIGAITDDTDSNDEGDNNNTNKNNNDADEDLPSGKAAFAPVLTLFITNIPFTSKEDEFYTFMLDACPRLAKTPEKHVERLAFEQDKGRAFLTLREQSTFTYVLQRLNGKNFAGRTLACVASKHTAAALAAKTTSVPSLSGTKTTVHAGDEDEEDVAKVSAVIARRGTANTNPSHGSHVPAGCDPLKLVVKNVPFEATERDIRDLFSAFSEVRSVRLPRKSHQFTTHRENNHRGFAFVEFLSEEEAKRAMETLKATHLYGRHLVLQYAKLDER